MTLSDDLRELRKENKDDHKAIVDRLDKMNGRVQQHSVAIATLQTVQGHDSTRITKAEEERGVLFKLVRALQSHHLKQAGVIAGAVAAAMLVLQYVVLPLLGRMQLGG